MEGVAWPLGHVQHPAVPVPLDGLEGNDGREVPRHPVGEQADVRPNVDRNATRRRAPEALHIERVLVVSRPSTRMFFFAILPADASRRRKAPGVKGQHHANLLQAA